MAKPAKPAKPKAKAKPPKNLFDADHIYAQLKICLSKITGFQIDQIHSTDNLEAKYHFNAGGRRVLAQNLEACFAQVHNPMPHPLDRDKMQAATTVGAVAEIINGVFG